MNVQEFIEGYNAAKSKSQYVKKHLTGAYIPFENKQSIADSIVQKSNYVEVNGVSTYSPNAILEDYRTDLWMISLYTDLELGTTGNDGLANYNLICECGALNMIKDMLSGDRFSDFNRLESMVLRMSNDEYKKNNNIPAYLESKLAGLGALLGGLMDAIATEAQGKIEKPTIKEVTKKSRKK